MALIAEKQHLPVYKLEFSVLYIYYKPQRVLHV